jgi:hypothetical protein
MTIPFQHTQKARRARVPRLLGTCLPCMVWLAFLVSPGRSMAQVGNLERLEESSRALCDSLLDSYLTKDPLCVEIVHHPASWIVEQSMLQSAAAHGVAITTCDSNTADALTLAVTAIGMEYHEIEAGDSLARDARIEATALVPTKRFRLPPEVAASRGSAVSSRASVAITVVRRDTVGADQTSFLESSGYDFAKGTLPPRQSSGVWKKIVEPAVVIGAAVVMAILLFTVRSQ